MSENRCKNCGGYMEKDNTLNIYICQYCGTKQAIQIEEKDNCDKQVPLTKGRKSIIEIFIIILFKVLFPLMVLYALYLCVTL